MARTPQCTPHRVPRLPYRPRARGRGAFRGRRPCGALVRARALGAGRRRAAPRENRPAAVVRISPTVEFTGSGAFADLYGIYFATDGQHLEHRIHVDRLPTCARPRGSCQDERRPWAGCRIRLLARSNSTPALTRHGRFSPICLLLRRSGD